MTMSQCFGYSGNSGVDENFGKVLVKKHRKNSKAIEISDPTNFEHRVHVGWDVNLSQIIHSVIDVDEADFSGFGTPPPHFQAITISKTSSTIFDAKLAEVRSNIESKIEAQISEMQSIIEKQAQMITTLEAQVNSLIKQNTRKLPLAHVLIKRSKSAVSRTRPACPPPPPPVNTTLFTSTPNHQALLMTSKSSTFTTPIHPLEKTTPLPSLLPSSSSPTINPPSLLTEFRRPKRFASCRLKPVPETAEPLSYPALNLSTPSKTLAYDYRNELAEQLKVRRKIIEQSTNCDFLDHTKTNESSKRFINPLAASMMARIPSPSLSVKP